MSRGLRVVSVFLSLSVMMVGCILLSIWFLQSQRFPLKTIEVRAELKWVAEADVKNKVLPYLVKGFFGLNVKSIQNSLEQLPWIQTVDIRRIWPDRLLISVVEKTAQGRWNDSGVLSTDGKIFYPDTASIPVKLPHFNGPNDRVQEILQQYFVLLEMLGPIGLRIQTIELSNEGTWQLLLDNGIKIVLGKTALNERMARFILAYPLRFQDKRAQIAYIDLRYTNGFAVGWKKVAQ